MTAEKNKKLSFGGGLLIYITVLLTVAFVALAFWWHYLSCYETARAERVMDAYMTQTLQADLEAAIDSYCDEAQTKYQTTKDISGVLTEAFSGDAWRYEANEQASTQQQTVFNLYCGDFAAGQVSLTVGESSTLNMGFRTWGDPAAKFNFDDLGKTLTVIVPYDCTVYLDDFKVGEDAVAETLAWYPQLEQYEAMIPRANQLLVYKIDGVFADVSVNYPVGYTAVPQQEEGVYYAVPACDDALGEQLTDYARNFVRAYVNYTANAEALWVLQQFIVSDSQLYKEITDSSTGLKWGHGVNAEVQTVEIQNFTYYGNAVTCDASYITKRDDGDRFELMKILMVNTDIGWRVVHMVNNEKTPAATPSPVPFAEVSADAASVPEATETPSPTPEA